MEVKYSKYVNKEGKVEFLLINFDYEDGNDYLAKIFQRRFNMEMEEKKDYLYFSIIKLYLKNVTYELLWHEDTGNSIYTLEQDDDSVNVLEQRLKIVLNELNDKLKEV